MTQFKLNVKPSLSGILLPVLVLAVGLGVYFFVLPKYREFKENRLLRDTKQADLDSKKSSLSGVKDLVASLSKNKEKLAAVDEALPSDPAVPELIADLDYLIKKSGLSVISIQMTLPKEQSGSGGPRGTETVSRGVRMDKLTASTQNVRVIEVDLNVLGTYNNYKTFLTNVQQNMRLLDITSFSSAFLGDSLDNLQHSVKIYTYFQKSP